MIYLHLNEGKAQNFDYEFGCESRSSEKQRNSAYFLFHFNNEHNLDQEQQNTNSQDYHQDSSDEDQSGTIQTNSSDQQQHKSTSKLSLTNNNSNFIAGVIYCNWFDMSQKLKDQFLYFFKESIYYQTNQYLEAFKDSIYNLQCYFSSLDLMNEAYQQVWSGYDIYSKTQLSGNFIMKIDQSIYLSKDILSSQSSQSSTSLSLPTQISNVWCIKEKDSNVFRKLNKLNDLQKQDNDEIEYIELNKDLCQNISDIILTDSTNNIDTLINQKIKEKYPILTSDPFQWYNLHYLKLSHFLSI